MSNNFILQNLYFLALLVVVYSTSCHTDYRSRSGSVSTMGQYGCNKEIFKIDFGSKQNVALKWDNFDVYGEMPYCFDHNLIIKIG